MKACALWAAALLLASGAAFAAPSLTAPDSGIVNVPTAYVAPASSVTVAASWMDLSESDNATPVRVVAGFGGKGELGAAWNGFDLTSGDEDGWGVAGKWQLLPETETQPAVAIGARYGTLDLGGPSVLPTAAAKLPFAMGEVKSTTVYGVVSKQLRLGEGDPSGIELTGHAGVAWHRLSFELIGTNRESKLEGFVALEAKGNQGTVLAAEYRSQPDEFSDDAITSVVVRHPFTPELTGELGWTNAVPGLDIADTEHNVFVGVTYTFGLGGY